MDRAPEDTPVQSPDRITQLEWALRNARELLNDYQNRHEASVRSWAQACQSLEARAEYAESRVRAFEAFQFPGAAEVAELSRRIAAIPVPSELDAQAFTSRLNRILGAD